MVAILILLSLQARTHPLLSGRRCFAHLKIKTLPSTTKTKEDCQPCDPYRHRPYRLKPHHVGLEDACDLAWSEDVP